jgi:hypothetical protein
LDPAYHASADEVVPFWLFYVFARLCCWLLYPFFNLKLQILLLSVKVASRFNIGHQGELCILTTMFLRSLQSCRAPRSIVPQTTYLCRPSKGKTCLKKFSPIEQRRRRLTLWLLAFLTWLESWQVLWRPDSF